MDRCVKNELEIRDYLEKSSVTVADMRKIAPRFVQQLFYSPDVMKDKQNNLWTVPDKVDGIPPEVVQVFRDPSNGTPRLRKCELMKLIAFLSKLYNEHKEKLPLSRVPDPNTREDQTVRDGSTTRDGLTVREDQTLRDSLPGRDGQVASTSEVVPQTVDDENHASSVAPDDIPSTVASMEECGNGKRFPARLPVSNREVVIEDITSAIRHIIREQSKALLLCATDPLIEKLENIQRENDVDEQYSKLYKLHRSLLMKNINVLQETEVIEAEADVIQPILGDVVARKAEADCKQPTSGDVILKGRNPDMNYSEIGALVDDFILKAEADCKQPTSGDVILKDRDPTQMSDNEIEVLEDHVKLKDLSRDWRLLNNSELEGYLELGPVCEDDNVAAPPTLQSCKRNHIIEAYEEHDHRYFKPPDEPATKKIKLNIQG